MFAVNRPGVSQKYVTSIRIVEIISIKSGNCHNGCMYKFTIFIYIFFKGYLSTRSSSE